MRKDKHTALQEAASWEATHSGARAEGDPGHEARAPGARPRAGLPTLAHPLADSGNQLDRCLVLMQLPQGKDVRLLTLYSADTPRSVSRSELHGNWPVTLYKFTEKLGDNGTEL